MHTINKAIYVGLGISGLVVGLLSIRLLPLAVPDFRWAMVTMVVVGFCSVPLAIYCWLTE